MRRVISHICVALLSFTIGIVTNSAWVFVQHAGSPKVLHCDSIQTGPAIERKIVFSIEGASLGTNGQRSFSNYVYSDGGSLQQTSVRYESAERANGELWKRLSQAKEIVRREPVLDVGGHAVGERVVATFVPYENSSVASAELLWTERPRFNTRRGPSLKGLLEDLDLKR